VGARELHARPLERAVEPPPRRAREFNGNAAAQLVSGEQRRHSCAARQRRLRRQRGQRQRGAHGAGGIGRLVWLTKGTIRWSFGQECSWAARDDSSVSAPAGGLA